MNDRKRAGSESDTPLHSPSRDTEAAKNRLSDEAGSASAAVSQATDAIKKEAGALGEEVRHFAEDQTDKVKDATASHMDVFADALRAASEELDKNHSGPAAEMVTHAASGLENLSRSLHGKSTGEMLDSVRQFGRDNPVGFLAGSLLAGFALSRFAVAGTSSATTTGGGTAAGGNATSRSNASPPPSVRFPQSSAASTSSRPSGATATASSRQGGSQR